MSEFLRKESWSKIERGYEYECALFYPSDTERPLSFFIQSEKNPNIGEITKDIGDFSPDFFDGKPKAKEQKVVFTIKPRKVVVVTNDEINQNVDYEYLLVAPINTIKSYEKQKDWYSLLIEDKHPIYTYVPNGNFDRYIDISQTTSIHKSLLLSKKSKLTEDRQEVLDQNILQCLALGIVDEDDIKEMTEEYETEEI